MGKSNDEDEEKRLGVPGLVEEPDEDEDEEPDEEPDEEDDTDESEEKAPKGTKKQRGKAKKGGKARQKTKGRYPLSILNNGNQPMCMHPDWTHESDPQNFVDAQLFLSLQMDPDEAQDLADELKDQTQIEHFKPCDILRACKVDRLPEDDYEVADHIKRMEAGEKMPPILLVRGDGNKHHALLADGYHRTCAALWTDPMCLLPCTVVSP